MNKMSSDAYLGGLNGKENPFILTSYLETIVESSGDAIIGNSLDGIILSWNKGAQDIFGYSPEEIIDHNIDILSLPKRPDEFSKIFEKIKSGNHVKHYDTILVSKEGKQTHASLCVSPIMDDAGRTIGVSTIAREISNQKHTDEAPRQCEERMHLAHQMVRFGTLEWDIQTGVILWTPELEALYGLRPGSFPGTLGAFMELVHPEDIPQVERWVRKSMETGLSEGEWRVIWPDGTLHWLMGLLQVFRDESGEPLRAIGSNMDITEQKRTKERKRHLASFPQLSPNPIIEVDFKGEVTFFNPATEKVLKSLGLIKNNINAFVPIDLDDIIRDWNKQNESTLYREKIINGKVFHMSIHLVPQFNTVRIYVYDVTKRKDAEEKLKHLNRLYAILSETNQAIARATDRDNLFQDICRIAVEHGDFRFAWIGLTDEETGVVKPIAWSGSCEYLLDNIRVTVNEEPEGMGPTGSAIRNGVLRIVSDTHTDLRTLPWQDEARKYGIRSAAAIPLKLNGKAIGAFALYAEGKNYFHGEMAGLLRQLSTDISFALSNLDREALRKEAERALREETLERLRTLEMLQEKENLLILQSRQAALGEMLSNIAHQWRQPLNGLSLLVQDIPLAYELGELDHAYVEGTAKKAMEQIVHMSRTIEDFMNFFVPDKEKVMFEVSQEVAKALALVKDSFKRFNSTLSHYPPCSLHGVG